MRTFSTVTEAEVAFFARENFDVNYETDIIARINADGVYSINARQPSSQYVPIFDKAYSTLRQRPNIGRTIVGLGFASCYYFKYIAFSQLFFYGSLVTTALITSQIIAMELQMSMNLADISLLPSN